MVRHSIVSVSEAYSALGLQSGSSLENVKSSYKQLALKTHPDKNPDNEYATEQFQRISEAYNVLVKHLDTSVPRSRPPFGGFSSFDGYGDEDDYNEFKDDEYDDYDSDLEEEGMAFYMFLFEEFLRGRSSRYSSQTYHRHRHQDHRYSFTEPEESDAARQTRLRNMRQDQEQAEARRAKEAADRKAQAQREREREMSAAAERREQKAFNKKAKAEAERETAAKSARSQQERLQMLRSAVFVAARNGDVDKVKKGIWEDMVDAAGGEMSNGCASLVHEETQDKLETLMHIIAKQGNKELLEWLGSHGADPEERNCDGLTAFHISLKHSHIPIIKYFFDNYPPSEAETNSIYTLSAPHSLLQLAIDSHEPEVVWMILHGKLSKQQEISDAWTYISSTSGKTAFLKGFGPNITTATKKDTYDEIKTLIMNSGGFHPPSSSKTGSSNDVNSPKFSPSPAPSARPKSNSLSSDGQGPTKPNTTKPPHHRRQSTTSNDRNSSAQSNQNPPRGRGRGRGRGTSRGRS